MKKTMKKLLSLLLVAVMLSAMMITSTSTIMSSAANTCGENVTWSFANKTLTISGFGEMENYQSANEAPWFSHRYNVKKIIVEEGVTHIGNYAFHGYYNMSVVVLPDSLVTIGDHSFEFCDYMYNITIGNNVTHIGKYAFAYCENISVFPFSDSLTHIGSNAFLYCKQLAKAKLPNGLVSIGDNAFAHCYNLSLIDIPNTVTNIDIKTFRHCCFTTVAFPNSLSTINKWTFSDCTSLQTVFIPINTTSVLASAFENTNVKDVYYEGTEKDWQKISIAENNTRLISATIHYNTTYEDYLCRDGHDWSISEDGYYNVCKVCGIQQSGPVFPAGYDSTRDVWSFKNPTNKIPAKYWTWLCSEVQAKEYEKDSGSGMCFGMSATAINLNSAFQTSYDFSKNSIYDISKNDNSNSLEISALKYIAYMQTSQINSLICDEEKKHSNNLQALYDAVYEYQTKGSKNSVGVNISISGRYFGEAHHSIMGIKVEDYSDRAEILVYDSNHPTKNKYLILKKDANGNFVSWQYELFSGLITVLWGTEFKDSEISFSTQSEVAYAALYGYLKGESLTEQDVKFFNNKYNLVKTKNASINNNDKLLKIKWSNIRIDDNITGDPASDIYMDDNYQYYWTSEDNIVFTAKGENASCKLLAQNTGISIDSFSGSTVELYGKENKLIANTTNGSEFTTTFISCDNPNSYVTATISGITSKETVTATQTETGLLVTGISDGTVTLSKDEEVIATKTVTDAISDIEITYDKTGADTSVELEYEQAECEHDDTDGDGKCDACGAPVATPPAPETPDTPADDDNSCSCICHSENSIVQFFYTIFRFLWQLFGMNMDCACGVKHFDFYIFA